MRILTGIVCLVALGTCPELASAQTSKVIPAYLASKDGNTSGAFPFGYTTARTQQIVTSSQICKVNGLITGLALRRDGASTGNMLARVVPNFTVQIGQTTVSTSGMSTTFANNRTSPLTTVFSGNYNLPANPPANPGPFNIKWSWTKPFLFLAHNGNLLIEFVAPGAPGKSSYFADHERITLGVAGKATNYGKGGTFASADGYTVTGVNSGSNVVPGGAFALQVKGLKKQYPNLAMFGRSNTKFGPISLPFSLTPLGAPGNNLYTELFIPMPIILSIQGSFFEGTATLPIPIDPFYTGITLYGQVLFADQPSNPMGIVASNGVSMTVGTTPTPFRCLGNYDNTKLTGSLNNSGFVLQLTGVFN